MTTLLIAPCREVERTAAYSECSWFRTRIWRNKDLGYDYRVNNQIENLDGPPWEVWSSRITFNEQYDLTWIYPYDYNIEAVTDTPDIPYHDPPTQVTPSNQITYVNILVDTPPPNLMPPGFSMTPGAWWGINPKRGTLSQ